MFHPQAPQPCYLYGWPLMAGIEAMYEALSKAAPDLVPSGSAADICAVMAWGHNPNTDKTFYSSVSLPVGQGAHSSGDGGTMFVSPLAQSRMPSAELQETKWPFLFHKWEFLPDSAGIGKYRGGLGWEVHFEVLTDIHLISTVERTRIPSWGQRGGCSGVANQLLITYPDGDTKEYGKITDLPVQKGSIIKIRCGGGGGFGNAAERDPGAVLDDVNRGYVGLDSARDDYAVVVSNVAGEFVLDTAATHALREKKKV